jgi:hypothetical protein
MTLDVMSERLYHRGMIKTNPWSVGMILYGVLSAILGVMLFNEAQTALIEMEPAEGRLLASNLLIYSGAGMFVAGCVVAGISWQIRDSLRANAPTV